MRYNRRDFMKTKFGFIGIFVLVCLFFGAAPVTAALAPTGNIVFYCDVDGAAVYINGVQKGVIESGVFPIEYDSAYTTYTVKKDGYYDATGSIDGMLDGQVNQNIDVTLTPKPTGSGKGWFVVHCNVNGASVAFNGATKGTISGGTYTFEVPTTGTPYTSFSVSKSGYVTVQDSIGSMPTADQTIDLYATLNPVPTTTVPTTVATPIGGDVGWIAVHSNVNGASVYFDNTYKGAIANGVLSVAVYTTGTPLTTYRVEKPGYVTVTGSLPTAPAKGVTKDITVTLSPTQTLTQAPVGSGTGQYVFHCSENGAEVYFDGVFKGMVNNGVASITVATTGTPAKTYEVRKSGFYTATGSITQYPANGQTIDIPVTLNPQMVTAPTTKNTPLPTTAVPVTTKSPLPITVTIGAVIMGALLMGVIGKRRN